MGNVCGAREIITVLPCGPSKGEISASLGPQSHPPPHPSTSNMLISLLEALCFLEQNAFGSVSEP
jgi:hypothetical protein